MTALQDTTHHTSRWRQLAWILLAAVLLNFLLSFSNVWPTALVWPALRLAPEFVALWVVLLCLVWAGGRVGPGMLALLSSLFLLLTIGHYTDVTVRALLGRPFNVYWDGYQLPTFLGVVSQALTGWQIAGFFVALGVGLWLLFRLIRICTRILAEQAAPRAVRSPLMLFSTLVAVVLVVVGLAGGGPAGSVIVRPVTPLYAHQAGLLLNAFVPSRRAKVLPPSPSLASDLQVLDGAEVKLLFLESYGATTYDRPEIAAPIDAARARLVEAAKAQGRQVLTGFVRAATFGGASDLSHLSLLSGIDLSDPLRHDVLLESDRPTLLDTFGQAGYRTIGLYPAMSWDWPEKAFYGFEHYLDAPDLGYRGPAFGLWWLPDQFTMARIDQIHPPDPDGRPRFLFYPTISSHIPFRPTPPYQPDWSRVTSDHPFDDATAAAALADGLGWNDLASAYVRSIAYTFEWLAGYQALPQRRESVVILLGDHQPSSSVSGPGASWDVPVHVVTSNPLIADRLREYGFSDQVNRRRPALGHVSELTRVLLSVFDGATVPVGRPDAWSALGDMPGDAG
ncbi:MAG: sulfatase-like hydrolase/transferase [Gammaproteobacteria bacterium]|nr:sulfatase-like hydrolase/transferase [Gammaproteobacteria bacterium]